MRKKNKYETETSQLSSNMQKPTKVINDVIN